MMMDTYPCCQKLPLYIPMTSTSASKGLTRATKDHDVAIVSSPRGRNIIGARAIGRPL